MGQTLAGLQAEEALVSRVAPRLVREVGADRSRPSHETLRRDSRYRRLLIAADILAASVALAFLAALSPGAGSAWLVALLACAAPLAAKLGGLYDRDDTCLRKSTLDEFPRLLALATGLTFATWVLSGRVLGALLSPGDAVAGWLLFASTMTVARCAARYVGIRHTQPERCLYIGGAESAAHFDDKLSHDRGANSTIIGHMAFAESGSLTAADARALVERMCVQRVIVAPETFGATEVLHIVRTFEVTGVHVSIVPALSQVLGSSVTVDSVDGSAVFGLKSFRLTRSSFVVKRLFDGVGACLILLL